jgi:dTDP-D-glucose 4,6-dehydratase
MHSEEIFITAITHDAGGDSITFTPALKYKHISTEETYGSYNLEMKAELGNLSRNIVI